MVILVLCEQEQESVAPLNEIMANMWADFLPPPPHLP